MAKSRKKRVMVKPAVQPEVTRWGRQILNPDGSVKVKMSPEGWFAYCIKKAGGIPRIAEEMGVSRQTIHASWHGRFPDKYVVQAEKLYGIPRRLLAPHLYE